MEPTTLKDGEDSRRNNTDQYMQPGQPQEKSNSRVSAKPSSSERIPGNIVFVNENDVNVSHNMDVGCGQMNFANDFVHQQEKERFAQMPAKQKPAPVMHPDDDAKFYGSTSMEPRATTADHFYYENEDYQDPFLMNAKIPTDKCCFLENPHSMSKWEGVLRSFCFGAIDGLLTGSGIAATFSGMHYLTPHASLATRWFVLAFTLATCASDGICMALGHIWSTHVLSNANAAEHRSERVSFENNRPEAKGKLIDMLVSRGMLKIDAMSIVDTLEGYPDIFISAIVGDSGHSLGRSDNPSFKDLRSSSTNLLALAPMDRNIDAPASKREYAYLYEPQVSSLGRIREDQIPYDPEAAAVSLTMKECRNEGAAMMISFSIFATVPSLVYLNISLLYGEENIDSLTKSITLITLSITSTVMLLLGVWKSTFFDASWITFGIEAVSVLLLCIVSAYTVGAVLYTFTSYTCTNENGPC